MERVAEIIGPVFALVAIGYASGRLRLLEERTAQGLADFVFKLALPAMLFHMLAKLELPEVDWRGLFAYYVVAGLVYFGSAAGLRRLFRLEAEEAGVLAMGAAFSNNVLLGLPIVLERHGKPGSLPLLLIISLHTAVLFGYGILYIESARAKGTPGSLARVLTRNLMRNPIVIGLALGLAVRASGLGLAPWLERVTIQFEQAAVPCALFSLGLGLCQFKITGQWRLALSIAAVKLIVHPFLMFLVAVPILGLNPQWASVSVLAAALPSGVNAYLFAQSYRLREATSAAVVLAATALGILTISLWLWFDV